MKIYGDKISGNCHKIKLIADLTQQDYQWIDVDVTTSYTRSKEFLKINPNGRIPCVTFDDGRILPESNAILAYLAHRTSYYPDDHWTQAQILQWLFFEQYSHEPYIATCRFWTKILGNPEEFKDEIERCKPKGYAALKVIDTHLASHDFLVGNHLTIADIALFAYTHVAHEGGYELRRYRNIEKWLKRLAENKITPM